jgi:hypothetical protein
LERPPIPARPAWRWLRPALTFLAWSLLFGLAYAQSPLYSSNQNQYFLHGAARAGLGYLSQDWLANTVDSVPVFSLLAELTYRYLDPFVFYLYYFVLFGIYLLALLDIVSHLFEIRRPTTRLLFLALMVVLHSAALRFVSSRLLGAEWEYLFDGGVAGQRLLGPVFQPSCFGVLLLLSLALFLRRRPYWAAAAAAAAATLHPTYLLGAAVLTLAYLFVTWGETRNLKNALALGMVALLLVLPILLYVVLSLGPTSAQVSREAQQVLVDYRIPHHAIVSQWLDATVLVKLALVILGIILARRSRLFPVLLVTFLAALALTALQILTGSLTLALLFPWRLSVILVPLATALLAAWLATRSPSWLRWLETLSLATVLALGLAGIVRFKLESDRNRADAARPMMAFIQAAMAPGDVYLIPPRLQEFRLLTGAPIVADFKSIPYRDVEVLEWYERARHADWFYRDRPEYADCGLLEEMRQDYGVTHVVLDPYLLELSCPSLHEIYRDPGYAVFTLNAP